MIRSATPSDAPALASIYNHYVMKTIVTFEEEEVSAADMGARIKEVQGYGLPWLVWDDGGQILGYAYANKWKARRSYRFSVESTVYLDHTATRRGLGTKLYTALIASAKEAGIHAVIGGVALPNPGSVALHERFGFKKSAQFSEVGWKFGQWIDVGYWELLLK